LIDPENDSIGDGEFFSIFLSKSSLWFEFFFEIVIPGNYPYKPPKIYLRHMKKSND